MFVKYPRTYHLPWSEGATSDDKILREVNYFIGKEVVVTEKVDGENTTLYKTYFHARSLTSEDHPSQHWLKNFHGGIKWLIPNDIRICGENLFAEHSIHYNKLPSYFLAFSIWKNEICLSYDEMVNICESIGIAYLKPLYRGIWDETIIKSLYTKVSQYDGQQEGYVVRLADEFIYKEFDKNVAKFVRANHVQTNQHWKEKSLIKNGIIY